MAGKYRRNKVGRGHKPAEAELSDQGRRLQEYYDRYNGKHIRT
ncbi:hypothetical protein [Gimesia maris]|nr:hypothetical protein [Gimesia maris]